MKSSNKMASDFFKVVLSNATVLASSIITALIIPKLMGASNYGYYKVYNMRGRNMIRWIRKHLDSTQSFILHFKRLYQ